MRQTSVIEHDNIDTSTCVHFDVSAAESTHSMVCNTDAKAGAHWRDEGFSYSCMLAGKKMTVGPLGDASPTSTYSAHGWTDISIIPLPGK